MSQKYFITGASGGLGIELVKTVLNAGHTVVAAVRRPEALADLAAQSGGRLIAEKLDVTQIGEIAAVAARHQDTDVLINNAGGAILGAMEELSEAQIQQQLDLNLVSPIYLTRAFLPAMRARKSGAIVYITSVGGRVSFPGGALYHAAKFGLEGFAETVAQEVAGFRHQHPYRRARLDENRFHHQCKLDRRIRSLSRQHRRPSAPLYRAIRRRQYCRRSAKNRRRDLQFNPTAGAAAAHRFGGGHLRHAGASLCQ
jgi:hypothetical protein